MAKLKPTYEKQEEIPEGYADLYTEKGGKWELTGVEGIQTQANIDRLQTSLTKERTDHKETKEKLSKFGSLDADQAQKDADEIAELKVSLETAQAAAGEGKVDQEAVDKLVDAKVATMVTPLKRELDKANETMKAQGDQIVGFELSNTNRTIADSVRKAATELKVIPGALDDVLMLSERVFENIDGTIVTKDGVGVTPGITADVWLTEMQDKRAHWWPVNQGGGAGGSGDTGGGGPNPFSAKDWNLTEQGAAVRADPAKAERLAKSAGTTVGGGKPAAPAA